MEAKTGRIICQCIPVNRLSPLEPHSESRRGAGNSSRTMERRRGMPSIYRQDSRSDPYDASMRNFAKARAKWRPPRPWRGNEESQMVRRFVLYWHTCRDRSRPSGRAWARQLGISHTWLQKLVRRLTADPTEMRWLQSLGDPRSADFIRAQESSRDMRAHGELRPLRFRQRKAPRENLSVEIRNSALDRRKK
jgi:hypothetical protein